MSFSYDSALSCFQDKVRFFAGDTVETSESPSDEELIALEALEPNVFLAAAQICEIIGSKLGRKAIEYDTASNVQGGLRVDRRLQPRWWFERAKSLKDRATNVAMNADEIIQYFDFCVDTYGVDDSDYIGDI